MEHSKNAELNIRQPPKKGSGEAESLPSTSERRTALALEAFCTGAGKIGAILSRAENVMRSPSARQDARVVLNRTLEHFTGFYRRLCTTAPLLPLALASAQPGDMGKEELIQRITKKEAQQVEQDTQYPSVNLSNTGELIDWLLDGALSETYGKFVKYRSEAEESGRTEMTPEEIEFRESIAQNVYPRLYTSMPLIDVTVGSIGDALASVIGKKEMALSPLNKLQQIGENNRNFSREKVLEMPIDIQVRVDLFRKYLGLQPYFSYLIPSPDRPTISTDPNASYTAFDTMVLIDALKEAKTNPPTDMTSFEAMFSYVQKFGNFPRNNVTSSLGKHIADIGYDEDRKERYVSYYDIWDIDPPLLKSAGIDIDRFNFPFEVYGRLYESDFAQNTQSK